jgi:uncharacterized protein (DUF1330 family)
MAAYLIVDTLLNDPVLYEEYKLKARPLIEKFGGEYLARGGRMTLRETDLWSPSRLVLVRFSDVETANRCLDSVEYRQICRSARNRRVEQRSSWRASKKVEGISGYRAKTGRSDSLARMPKAATLVLHAAKLHERGHPFPKKVAVLESHEPIWWVDG